MRRLAINTVFVTRDRHWMKGSVSTEGRRLLDVLNDPSHKYIRVQGLQLSGNNAFTGGRARPEAWVQKSKLDLVILTANEHETPEKRWDNYSPKKRTRITALAAGFDLEADLHQGSSIGDIQSTLESTPGCFFPLTAVRVTPMDLETDPFTAGVVLVNKYCITLLADLEAEVEQTKDDQPKDRFSLSRPEAWGQSSETEHDPLLN